MSVDREHSVTLPGARRSMRSAVIAASTGLLLCLPVVMASGELADPSVTVRPTAAEPSKPDTGSAAGPTEGAQREPSRAKAAIAAAEEAAGRAELGIAVLDRRTGELVVGKAGTTSFYTASLSKVLLAVDMLDRRRLEGLAIEPGDVDLLSRALGPSDDAAMSTLWGRFDGPGVAARISKRLGLVATKAPRDPSQWGEMSVSAADNVRVWRYILADLPPADRDLLISDMAAAPAQAKDGFNQAFGLLAPEVDGPGGPGAVAKQAWMCCFSGIYYLHSSGVLRADQRFVVTLLTRISRTPGGWDAARGDVTRIAAAVAEALERPSQNR